MKNIEVGIIGLGRLGVCLATVLAKHFKVYGVDISERRIQQILNRKKFFEPSLKEYLEKYDHNLTVSLSYQSLAECRVVFIITQTPSLSSGKFDLQYVESALRELYKVNPECLAVVSSTINIGDMDKLRNIHKRIAYNPEFIKQGSIIHDFLNPKFVLIGAYTQKDGTTIANIWRKFHNKPIYTLKPVEAEITKLSLNVSFTLGITFANMIGELCKKCDADSNKVLDVVYQDRRKYTVGLGFSGPCFGRDVNCFKTTCIEKTIGSGHRFANLLNILNNYTVEKYLRKIKSFYPKRKISILGVSYKPHVPYIYDSQPLEIAQKLSEEGYEIHIYDPLAEENAKQVLPQASFHPTIKECIEKGEVIFIGTSDHLNVETDKPVINPWS